MSEMEEKVRYVARLARIKLTDEEVGLFSRQLDGILGYVDKLNRKLDIQGKTLPMSHPHEASNSFRADEVKPSLPPEKVLANAPQKKGDFFKVPRIIEE
ncbi:MAG: Asp-tRNA(Asn)/Glu-tRNA(Gln) amidotransferase subunit GatC [Candidatus Omnitrophota bacterium]|jgi:aspartyl-tRNA(Asn)/glutamyl-tRNA(Gln) amidotransferase subunit C